MALTPAREYFGSQIDDGLDPTEQWNRKKMTTEQKRAAKKAKLDPANHKSALDVMKERERKRKRELGMDGEEAEGEVKSGDAAGKKQKVAEVDDETRRRQRAEKRKEKRVAKKEKQERKRVKAETKKAAKQDQDLDEALEERRKEDAAEKAEDDDEDDVAAVPQDGELAGFDASGLAEEDTLMDDAHADDDSASSAPSSPVVDSPAFDVAHSAASSSSSIVPPSHPTTTKTTKSTSTTKSAPPPTLNTTLRPNDLPSGTSSPKIQLPNIDQAELQERLRQRIEELRARRKADGPEGKPAKSRQDLLDQRRKKEEQRKVAKKEQRRKQKEDEARKREDELRRGSGSPLSNVDMFSPREDTESNNFSFTRLAFADGTSADPSLSTLHDAKRRKGPSDPRTALEAAQKKASRLSALDPTKRGEIEEKDMWLHARQRAAGVKVKDDTSLLKKALKRKEKGKGKSEREWKEREEGVVKGREARQKKREGNLAKRREEKGSKGKGSGKGKKGAGAGKGKRAGFEGRFKA